jgi:putative nucleotidyltransferase with HDIG domain
VSHADVDFAEIVETVRLDPALTGRLLKAANSAAAGGRTEVTTVRLAVSRLGTGAVLSVAMSFSVRGRLSSAVPAYDLGEGDLWRHSVLAALAAEEIRKLARNEIPPDSFTAALLHDVGKLVLGRYLDSDSLEALRRAREQGSLDPVRAEEELLMVNHGEVGGLIAQKWGLPLRITQAITYHHHPEQHPDPTCATVAVANAIAKCIPADGETLDLEQVVPGEKVGREVIGLSEEDFCSIVEKIGTRFDELRQKYS